MIDSVGELRQAPVQVHATPETIRILRTSSTGWGGPIFPRFPTTTSPSCASIRSRRRAPRQGGRGITALPARHTVPAVAYRLDSAHGRAGVFRRYRLLSWLIEAINDCPQLRHLILAETAFAEEQHGSLWFRATSARAWRARCSTRSAARLRSTSATSPGVGQRIIDQLGACAPGRPLRALGRGDILEF